MQKAMFHIFNSKHHMHIAGPGEALHLPVFGLKTRHLTDSADFLLSIGVISQSCSAV